MLDALRGDEGMREILNQRGFAAHKDHFEAVVVVEMNVNAR